MKFRTLLKEYLPYLIALLPILLLRDFSPDNELRYVSIANEALHNNQWWAFTFQGEPYADKPPLYIWIVMVLKIVLGHHYMVSIGLFSLIPAIGILMVMNRWIERYDVASLRLCDGSQSRSLASFMLFTSGLQLGMAFFLRMDMLMCLWIVLALYTFWRIVTPSGSYGGIQADAIHYHKLQWCFGLYVFLGIFTKGPMGVLIPLVSILTYLISGVFTHRNTVKEALVQWCKVWNWRAWLIILSLCTIWFYCVYREGGEAYIENLLYHQTVDRAVNAYHHNRPWFYYLGAIWYDSLLWGPLCLIAIVVSLWRNHRLGSPLQSFFLSIFLSTFVMLSCISGKIDVYLLPVYPFLIYLGVMQFHQWRWPLRWHWRIIYICRSILVIVFIAGLMMPQLNPYIGSYGRICYRANRIGRSENTEHVYVYKLRRTAGMDAYLHQDPIEADDEMIAGGQLRNTLLITKQEKWDELLESRSLSDIDCQVVSEFGPFIIVQFH